MEERPLDEARVEAFSEKLVGILNGGALALMTSVGHRTGLFDTMDRLPPATSEQIASEADLNERYVREWLGAMVVGGIVDYDAESAQYDLAPEHAAVLTRKSQADNIAVFAQYIPILGSVEDRIVQCFREGGGVAYSEFPRFHDVMAEESGQSVLSSLNQSILPLVPGLIATLERGIRVLDVGCGSGRAINLMAKTYPRSSFTGYDFSDEAITNARNEAARSGLTNARFEVKDVSHLKEPEPFDLITAFDAIHDQAAPDKVLEGIAGALRAEGTFLMQDIAASSQLHENLDHPIGPLLYTISAMHCMTVSLAAGGAGLGTMWGEEKARAMLGEAGFGNVEVKHLPHDFQNAYYIVSRNGA